jgi:hypothetical protein
LAHSANVIDQIPQREEDINQQNVKDWSHPYDEQAGKHNPQDGQNQKQNAASAVAVPVAAAQKGFTSGKCATDQANRVISKLRVTDECVEKQACY